MVKEASSRYSSDSVNPPSSRLSSVRKRFHVKRPSWQGIKSFAKWVGQLGKVAPKAVEIEMESVSGVGARDSMRPGFTHGVKWTPNNEVYRDLSEPLVKETQLSSPMRARAASRVSVSPVASPQYTTLQSIKTGEALKQAYAEVKPFDDVKRLLKGGSRFDPIHRNNVKPVSSLGGEKITPQQLFKNIKGELLPHEQMQSKVASAMARVESLRVGDEYPRAESHKSHLKRIKAAEKQLKSNEKVTKRVLKNAKQAVSKHIDAVVRQQQRAFGDTIKASRPELSALHKNLRMDLKRIQTEPIKSNDIVLKNVGVDPASRTARQPGLSGGKPYASAKPYTFSGVGEADRYSTAREASLRTGSMKDLSRASVHGVRTSEYDDYKPRSEADRTAKFDRRWRAGREAINNKQTEINAEIQRVKALRSVRRQLKKGLNEEVRKISESAMKDHKKLKSDLKGVKKQANKALSAEKAAARAARF
ncbi:MAG: hypothetical protein AB2660_16720, partial [Candidatus Thiodiazotropha sp.]